MLFAEQLAARAAEKQRSIATPIIDTDNDCNTKQQYTKIKQQLDETDTTDILSNTPEISTSEEVDINTNITHSGEDRKTKIENSDTSSNNKNAFDLQTFNQLRVERIENQRIAEERKWKASRGLLRRSYTTNVSENFLDSSDITETEKISARQELLHLGRRYASQQSSGLILSSPTQKEIDQFIPNSDANLMFERRSSIPALELLSPQSNGGNSVVTPDEKIIPKEKDDGVYGYLLLARTSQEIRHQNDNVLDDEDRSASPAPYLQASSACNSHNEDGSSCEDHHSLDDQQQSGNILDHFASFVKAQVFISEIEGNINSSPKQTQVSSICTNESDSQIVSIMKSNNVKEWRMRARAKAVIQSLLVTFVIAAMCLGLRYITIWYKLAACSEWSTKLSTQYHSLIHLLRWSYWSTKTMLKVLNSKLDYMLSRGAVLYGDAVSWLSYLWEHAASNVINLWNTVVPVYIKYQTNVVIVLSQFISVCKHTASRLIFWVNRFGKWQDNNRKFVLGLPNLIHSTVVNISDQTLLLWEQSVSSLRVWMQSIINKPYEVYAAWRQNFDMLSWTIGNVYRLEKAYYDIIELLSVTKDRLVEVQESSFLALNVTLSTVVSLWQDMRCEDATSTSNLSLQDDARMLRRLSLTTTPVVFWSDGDEYIPKHSNKTTTLINEVDATTQEEEIVAPQFWASGNTRGMPFIKYQSRHRLGSKMIPPLDLEHWNQSGISYPLVLLRHPHLSLNHPHFLGSNGDDNEEHILHSSMALSTVKVQRETHQAPTTPTEGKNYYAASYPVEGKPHDRDIFNEVDILDMARDFVGKVLERRRSSKQELAKQSG